MGCVGSASAATEGIHKPEVVYLHAFPSTPHVYNISPFAIKVESFLRLHDIPYVMVYTSKFGSKGQIPYVLLNGEEVCDSNVIIPKLKEHFKIDCDARLTAGERAVSHATMRMVEEHTAQIGFYYRYGLHMDEFYEALDIPERLFNSKKSAKGSAISSAWKSVQPGMTKKKMKSRGLAAHSDNELWSFSADDLRAISDFLGDKPYFHGEEASTIDCVLFGHLSQFIFIPIDFPQKHFLLSECQNVVDFVHRFRAAYWPDWEQLCSGVSPQQQSSLPQLLGAQLHEKRPEARPVVGQQQSI